LSVTDLTVINAVTGAPLPQDAFVLAYDPASHVATFTYTGGALADGRYRATIAAGTIALAGQGALPSDYTLDFFALAGDANHDATVNFDDLVPLAQNYNASDKSFAQGDFTGDGKVDFNDLVVVAQ